MYFDEPRRQRGASSLAAKTAKEGSGRTNLLAASAESSLITYARRAAKVLRKHLSRVLKNWDGQTVRQKSKSYCIPFGRQRAQSGGKTLPINSNNLSDLTFQRAFFTRSATCGNRSIRRRAYESTAEEQEGGDSLKQEEHVLK